MIYDSRKNGKILQENTWKRCGYFDHKGLVQAKVFLYGRPYDKEPAFDMIFSEYNRVCSRKG
ncbi:hypothetical protein D3Z51_15410 [Clostridiaceae bacterium]|nr:hypothetical protein [Clostridiaceae bacterium]RKI10763.1 hypothetical protein D7V81_15150 [bacterium 1XD21-70]